MANLLLTLPFILLFWIDLVHHEMWLDELNAWGIAAASPSLHALFANVHYEGHPWLWYFVLWIPSRFTHAPVAMKWVEAMIGASVYLIIGLLSPFTPLQKVLLFLNYFVAFEYTVISRTYGLVLLFALVYVWHRASRPRAYVVNLGLLGALANTDMTGILLSGALLLEYLASQWPVRHGAPVRRAVAATLLYFALLLFSVYTLTPAPDISWATTGHLFSQARNLPHLIHCIGDVIVAPWWPFANGYPKAFWNVDVEFHKSALGFIPVILAGYYWIFRKHGSLLVLMGATIVFAISFAHLVYLGFVRHWGISVAAYLLALWILSYGKVDRRSLSPIAYGFLLIGSIKGAGALAASWTHPFSEINNVVGWMRENHLDQEPIAGTGDYHLAGVAEELQRPVYFLDCNCVDTYMKFAHRRDGMSVQEVPGRIVMAMNSLHTQQMILVMGFKLPADELSELAARGLAIQALAHFSGSEDSMEYYLYRVTTPGESAHDQQVR